MNIETKLFISLFVGFSIITIATVWAALTFVNSFDCCLDNPDNYTVNYSEITTYNGHSFICVYKENDDFAYVLGCKQKEQKQSGD